MELISLISAFIGIIVGFAAFLAIGAIVNGYVFSILWGWFVVPVFHVPELGVATAIGLSMVVTYLTAHYDGDKAKDPEAKSWAPLAYTVMRPLVALGLGAIVHHFA